MWEREEREERKTWCVICADALIVIENEAVWRKESDGSSAQCVFNSTVQFRDGLWAPTTVREGSVKTLVTRVNVRPISHYQQKNVVFILLSWREHELRSITVMLIEKVSRFEKVSKMQGGTFLKGFIRHQRCFRTFLTYKLLFW